MKTRNKLLGRRRVLLGMLNGAVIGVALPRLEFMLGEHGDAWAQGNPLPRRFGVWALACGVHLQRWNPATTGPDYALSPQLAPLAPVKDQFTVVSGTELPAIGANPTRGHSAANTILMTGLGMTGRGDDSYTAAGKSIDQMVADSLPATTRKSLEVGVTTGPGHEAGTAFHWWSHNGPDSPNICSYDCAEVFDLLFAGGLPQSTPSTPSLAAMTRQTRTSILDYCKADTDDLMKIVGATDRQRLEQHLEGIFAIERRLQGAADPGGVGDVTSGCTAPVSPAEALVGSSADYDDNVRLIHRTMAELTATALACDLTRVFTFQVMQPGSRVNVRTITGNDAGFHGLSHGNIADESCHKVVVAMMDELRVFIEIFRDTPDGAGNLLDSCAILASNDCNQGPEHGLDDYPMLIVGKAGGLKMGHHLRLSGVDGLRVPLTLARAAGAQVPALGEATESLSELLS
jgi:hypothetical protein